MNVLRTSLLVGACLALLGVLLFVLNGAEVGDSIDPLGLEASKGEVHAVDRSLIGDGDMGRDSDEDGAGEARTRGGDAGSDVAYDSSIARIIARVIDPDGKPIRNAEVRVHSGYISPWMEAQFDPEDPFDARTAADGRFQVETTPGPTRVFLGADGFAPANVDVNLLPGETFAAGSLTLRPGVRIEGTVRDPLGGPVADVVVRLGAEQTGFGYFVDTGQLGQELARTDDAGHYEVHQLKAGDFRLHFDHPHHPVTTQKGHAENDTGVVRIDATFDPSVSIRGTVLNRPNDKLDLVVQAERADQNYWYITGAATRAREGVVQPDGSYWVRGLKPDLKFKLSVQAKAPGELYGDTLSPEVLAVSGARGVELTCRTGLRMSMTVIDAVTGRPVTRFQVVGGVNGNESNLCSAGNESTDHQPEGRLIEAHVDGTDESEWKLQGSVSAVGYATLILEERDVSPGQSLDLGTVQLEPLDVLRVHVVDATTGRGIEGAQVSVSGIAKESTGPDSPHPIEAAFLLDMALEQEVVEVEGAETRAAVTDEHGVARMTSIPGESVWIGVKHGRYADQVDREDQLPLGPCSLTIEMQRGCFARVRVVDVAGEPVLGAQVEHMHEHDSQNLGSTIGGGTRGRRVDRDGWVAYRHLMPGTHSFRVVKESMDRGTMNFWMNDMQVDDRPWSPVELDPKEPVELVLIQEPTTVLHGQVLEAGRPLGGADVRLVDPDADEWTNMMGGGPKATSDARGFYSIENIDPKTWSLQVDHATRAMKYIESVELRAGATRMDLNLPVTAIEGRVTDAGGAPVEGARVTAHRVDGQNTTMIFGSFSTDDGESVGIGDPGAPDPVFTDSDGRYRLVGVDEDAQLRIQAKRRGFIEGSIKDIQVERNATRRGVDLTLAVGGGIEILVRWTNQDQARPLFVTLNWAGEGSKEPRYQYLEGEGTIVGDLEPGPWKVDLETTEVEEGEPEQRASQEIEIRSGETGVCEFQR